MKISCIDNIQRSGECKEAEKLIARFIECAKACTSDTVDKIELLGNVVNTERGNTVNIYVRGIDEYSFSLSTTNMPEKTMFCVTYKDSGMIGNVDTLPNAFAINKIQRVIKELEV